MSEPLPKRLSREACADIGTTLYGDDCQWDGNRAEQYVIAAIRAALNEAARVAREHEIVLDDTPFAKWTTKGGRFAQEIAAAIEAL